MGLTGAGHSVGTTHLAVWTANWLTSVRRERTAVLEWNDHGDFEQMRRFVQAKSRPDGSWSLLGVDYFPAAESRELAACMDRGYRRILVDYGVLTEAAMLECVRCDQKMLVGSLSEWKAEMFLDAVRGISVQETGWRCAAVFGSEELRRSVKKELGTAVYRIPYSEDAFAVTGEDLDFFRKWQI